jgi:hypothetical protein
MAPWLSRTIKPAARASFIEGRKGVTRIGRISNRVFDDLQRLANWP